MPGTFVLAKELEENEANRQYFGSDDVAHLIGCFFGCDTAAGMDQAKLAIINSKRKKKNLPPLDSIPVGNGDFSGLPVVFGKDNAPPEQPPATAVDPDPAPTTTADKPATQTIEIPPTQPPNTGDLVIKQSEFQVIVDRAAQAAIAPSMKRYQEQIDGLIQSQNAEQQKNQQIIDTLNAQLNEVKAESDRKTKILESTGSSIPLSSDRGSNGAVGGSYAVNYLNFGTSKEPQGAAKDFADFTNNPVYCRRSQIVDQYGGVSVGKDNKAIDKFVRQHRDALRADMERYAKGNGLLLGTGADATAGMTLGGTRGVGGGMTGGTIPQAFIDYLSSEMRMAKHPKYIWHQFANAALGLGTPVGSTILVPKFDNLDEATNEADYTLDTITTITTIGADSQALAMNTVPVTIKGYGLGNARPTGTPAQIAANKPVAIPEFIQVTSLVELMSVLNQKLTRNYNSFVDMMIRGYYRHARFNAANVYYNNSGAATTNPAQIVNGSDGTMTLAFLDNMFAAATDEDIPSLADGRRVAILSNKSASQLKTDLGAQWEAPSAEALQSLTNIMNASYPGGEVDNVSGYMGEYGGFHCFHNLSSSRGAAGSEGVYTGATMETAELVAPGAGTATIATDGATGTAPADAVMRDNYFFGPDAVAKGTAMPMQIRMDPTTNFDRMYRFIWYEICGFGPIAVSSRGPDAAGAALQDTNQENCVLIGRTSDTVL